MSAWHIRSAKPQCTHHFTPPTGHASVRSMRPMLSDALVFVCACVCVCLLQDVVMQKRLVSRLCWSPACSARMIEMHFA